MLKPNKDKDTVKICFVLLLPADYSLLHYTRSFTVKMSAGNVCHPRDLRLFQIPVMLSSIIAKLLVSAVTEINQLVYDYCADLLRHKTAVSCGGNRSCTVLLTTV